MIDSVVVTVNKMKPLIHAYCSRKGDRNQYAVVSGFFCFRSTSVLRTIARVQPDCAEGKGTRYVVRLGGSSRIIRATGRIIKSRGIRRIRSMMMPLGGEAPFPFYSIGVGGSLGEIIHKREYKGCV